MTPNEMIGKLNKGNVWNTQGQIFYERRVQLRAIAKAAEAKLATIIEKENSLRERMNPSRTGIKNK